MIDTRAPTALSSSSPLRPLQITPRRRGYLAYYFLAIMIWALLTCVALFVVAQESIHAARAHFERGAQEVQTHLHDRLRDGDVALFGFASLLGTLDPGDRVRAEHLARTLVERYPHIYQLEVVRKVSHQELPAFVDQMRYSGSPEFQPKTFSYDGSREFGPLQEGDHYYLLVSMQPQSAKTAPILGLDVGSVPFLDKAFRNLEAKGGQLAGPLFQLAEGGGDAYKIFRPIVRAGAGETSGKGVFGGTAFAAVVVLTATLEPPLEKRDHRVSYELRHRGYPETAFGDTLFAIPAEEASPLERRLLGAFRLEREFADMGLPFHLVMVRHLRFGDLHGVGLLSVLALALAALVALLVHFRTLERQGRLLQDHADQILHLALHDQLTGLPNRRLLDDRLTQAVELARRHNDCVGVLFLDLDGFKAANDQYGHAVGDAILREVSTRLRDCVRDADTVARYGGDEFVLVCSGLQHASDALAVGEKIRQAVNAAYHVDGRVVAITPSIGISVFPENSDEAYTLLNQADVAMYRAKSQGRNRVQIYRKDIA